MAITINGTGTITGISAGGLPDNCVTAADLATTLDLSSNPVTLPSGTGGKILQVVQQVKTSQFAYGPATAFTDITGFNVSITPSSTANKILVLVNINVATGSNEHLQMRLLRDSTDIFIGDADGSRTRCTFHMRDTQSYGLPNYSGQFLDSPSTTSAVTYKMQIGSPSSNYSARVNCPSQSDNASYTGVTASTITAMEVAG